MYISKKKQKAVDSHIASINQLSKILNYMIVIVVLICISGVAFSAPVQHNDYNVIESVYIDGKKAGRDTVSGWAYYATCNKVAIEYNTIEYKTELKTSTTKYRYHCE